MKRLMSVFLTLIPVADEVLCQEGSSPDASAEERADADPVTEKARALFEEARTAQGSLDFAAAQAKAAEAIDLLLGFAEGYNEARIALLHDLGTLACACGDAHSSERALRWVLKVLTQTLSEDDPNLQAVRINLASTILDLGDLAGARDLQQQALNVLTRTKPDDDPNLQSARANLAITMRALGDYRGARTLQRHVLEVLSETLPDDHPDLLSARASLAITMRDLGDLRGARALQEQVLDISSRTLPVRDFTPAERKRFADLLPEDLSRSNR